MNLRKAEQLHRSTSCSGTLYRTATRPHRDGEREQEQYTCQVCGESYWTNKKVIK